MVSRHAMTLFMRLSSHHPALGGDDSAAEVRTVDWCAVIAKARPDVAEDAVSELINGWPSGAGVPKIADFQDACRRIAQQRALGRPALEPGEVDLIGAERLAELLAEAHGALKRVPNPKPIEHPSFDPAAHMPTYADVYGPKEPE